MIVYYAMSKFHLIFSITHKLTEHRDEKAILYLYAAMQDLDTNLPRLEKADIFEKIFLIDEINLRKGWKGLPTGSSETDIKSNIQVLCDAVDQWLPYRISEKDTLYIANDHWALGIYCIWNKIPYIYYEDGVGMLSKPEYSLELVRKLNQTHAVIAQYIHAFGLNDCVIKKLADLDNQTEGFLDEKAEHYCLKEKLRNLPEKDIEKLLYIFNAPKFWGFGRNKTILLTEHFVNMKRLTIEGQIRLYSLLVDFFNGDNQLFIKPHPNDLHLNYLKIFPDAQMVPSKFPSELLPFCFEEPFDLGLAACSTSVLGLKDMLDHIIRFDTNIENTYLDFFRYYTVSRLLKGSFKDIPISHYGLLDDLFHIFMCENLETEFVNPSCTAENQEQIYLIDNWKIGFENSPYFKEPKDWNDNDIVVFLNSSLNYDFFEYLSLQNHQALSIVSIKIYDKNPQNTFTHEERIYIYSKSKNIHQRLEEFRLEKELTYSNLHLSVEAITSDPKLQIKILEGNLAATNIRLKAYIDNEVALKNRIDELEKKLATKNTAKNS